MKYAPHVVFSLALVMMTEASVTSDGASFGSSRECLGIRDEQNHRQTGVLKKNCEISSVSNAFLATETAVHERTQLYGVFGNETRGLGTATRTAFSATTTSAGSRNAM